MLDFKWRVKQSFKQVRKDVEDFRDNANDWIVFLDEKGNEVERRLDKIEDRIERMEEAMFKILSMR